MKPTYEELEAKCAALAAEVEAVKSAHKDAVGTIMYTANRTGVLYTEKVIQMSCKTPATDAFLAEVRASAVDGAVGTIMVHMNHQHVAVAEALHILRTHASKLRQEAAQ